MKKILVLILSFFSATSFAFAPVNQSIGAVNAALGGCAQAAPTTDPGFCPSFATIARCQCLSRGVPEQFCRDMNSIYQRMIDFFGSVDRACEYQEKTSHDTTKQQCMDDWKCYRSGGTDSRGGLCSASGSAC